MSDFTVAHQTLGQSDSKRRGLELSVAVGIRLESVHDGGFRICNGVALTTNFTTPTVNDD